MGLVDEERGEGGLNHFAAQAKEVCSTTSEPRTPTSPCSQGTTVFGRSSTCSDDRKSSSSKREGGWLRYVNSFRTTIGSSRRSQSGPSEPSDEDTDETDDEEEESEPASTIRRIHTQPKGYGKLAAYLDSDENFMIYRRFGWLQSRLLLETQDELVELERDLDIMETRESSGDEAWRLKSRRDSTREKKVHLDKIREKWTVYTQLLTNAAAMTALHKPTTHEQRSVQHFLYNKKPIDDSESKFIRCKEDLVILRPGREHAWLDTSVEHVLRWKCCAPLRRFFQSPDTRAKNDGSDGTILYTRGRIENFVVAIITFVILALLIVPIWLLWKFTESAASAGANGTNPNPQRASLDCIGVLMVSTLAFSACISLFTRAKRHEILAASAAYCAVLVVFFGNLGQNNSNGGGAGFVVSPIIGS